MTAGFVMLAALILAAIITGMLVPRYRTAATLAVVGLVVFAMVVTKPHTHPRGVTHAFVVTPAPARAP